jgi:hypothetical protein
MKKIILSIHSQHKRKTTQVEWTNPQPGIKPKRLCEACGKGKVAAKVSDQSMLLLLLLLVLVFKKTILQVTFREYGQTFLRKLCKPCALAAQAGAQVAAAGGYDVNIIITCLCCLVITVYLQQHSHAAAAAAVPPPIAPNIPPPTNVSTQLHRNTFVCNEIC